MLVAAAAAAAVRLDAHLFGIEKALKGITTSTRRFAFPTPRNVSLNGSSPAERRNVSETPTSGSTRLNARTCDSVAVSLPKDSPLNGLEDQLMSFVLGKTRATEVSHLVWKHVVQKGDTVVDATCGNGHDTLAMLKMVSDESGKACVYALDIQEAALQQTSSLLEQSVSPNEKALVKLFSKCHSKMNEVIPRDTSVRLVAFNLGYLPGGDKTSITQSQTTLEALEVAKSMLVKGGLISLVVYVGHPGGGEELKTVQHFVSKLSIEEWTCSEFQTANRSCPPVLVFIFRRC